MQLKEIKNDLAIINYNPEINKLILSDFILIEDTNQSILAQIISIETTSEEDVNSAMLKFLLSIDKDANLTQYSGYVPAKNASLILINPQEVVQLIKGSDKNIYIGALAAYPDIPVELSIDFLRKKTYIQVDSTEKKQKITETILAGLQKYSKKTILFDFQGIYEHIVLPVVAPGKNFKLPLNYEALCFIAEEELDSLNNDNKAIIQGILFEVEDYVKTTAEKFIPIDTLIEVVDSQYKESTMPELLLLKNKLLKYKQQGIFAQSKSEFDFLDGFLKNEKNFKFDLTELPSHWHRVAFSIILDLIKSKYYMIADFTDENTNKATLKKISEKSEIRPIIISSYEYIYQLQIKAISKNLILFKPGQKVNDFAGYTSFLNILNQDNFIAWGEQTLFIPLIVNLKTVQFDNLDKQISLPNITDFKLDCETSQQEVEQQKVAPEKVEPYDESNISESTTDSENEEFTHISTDETTTTVEQQEQEIISEGDENNSYLEPAKVDVIENIIEPEISDSQTPLPDVINVEPAGFTGEIKELTQVEQFDYASYKAEKQKKLEEQFQQDIITNSTEQPQDSTEDTVEESYEISESEEQEETTTGEFSVENNNEIIDTPVNTLPQAEMSQPDKESDPQTENIKDKETIAITQDNTDFDLPNEEDMDFFFENEIIDTISDEILDILADEEDENIDLYSEKTEFVSIDEDFEIPEEEIQAIADILNDDSDESLQLGTIEESSANEEKITPISETISSEETVSAQEIEEETLNKESGKELLAEPVKESEPAPEAITETDTIEEDTKTEVESEVNIINETESDIEIKTSKDSEPTTTENEQDELKIESNQNQDTGSKIEPQIESSNEEESTTIGAGIDKSVAENNDESIVEDLNEDLISEDFNKSDETEDVQAEEHIDNNSKGHTEEPDDNISNKEEIENKTAVSSELENEENKEEPKNNIQNLPKPAVEIKSPQIPIVNTNSAPQFNTKFAQGTFVHHPKYGRGTVEKVIQYGSKELCLIIFDKEGRKLLDPNLADIKQI